MKLIIDIDDELVETARFAVQLDMGSDYVKSIANGIPLDNLRSEITAIVINGQVDEHTMFIRSGEQVKQMALDVIDKYKAEEKIDENMERYS